MSLTSSNATMELPLLNPWMLFGEASMVAENPTATTLVMGCLATDTACNEDEIQIIVGPWAAATPAPGVDPATLTGRYEEITTARTDHVIPRQTPVTYLTAGETVTLGCDMTSVTVALACTYQGFFTGDSGFSVAIFTETDPVVLEHYFGFKIATLAITGSSPTATAPMDTLATTTSSTSTGSAARTGSGSTSAGAATTPTESAGPTGAGGRTGASTRSVLACLMLASVVSSLF